MTDDHLLLGMREKIKTREQVGWLVMQEDFASDLVTKEALARGLVENVLAPHSQVYAYRLTDSGKVFLGNA